MGIPQPKRQEDQCFIVHMKTVEVTCLIHSNNIFMYSGVVEGLSSSNPGQSKYDGTSIQPLFVDMTDFICIHRINVPVRGF